MNFQKDFFLSNLLTLRPTEEHLKSLAYFIKTFESQEETIIEGIRFTHKNSSIHHRITLYYLMNEILCIAISNKLKMELKKFIKEVFFKDIQHSLRFETLNKKLLELEKVWNKRKILSFEIDLDEITMKIKDSIFDKEKLIGVLKDILKELEKES